MTFQLPLSTDIFLICLILRIIPCAVAYPLSHIHGERNNDLLPQLRCDRSPRDTYQGFLLAGGVIAMVSEQYLKPEPDWIHDTHSLSGGAWSRHTSIQKTHPSCFNASAIRRRPVSYNKLIVPSLHPLISGSSYVIDQPIISSTCAAHHVKSRSILPETGTSFTVQGDNTFLFLAPAPGIGELDIIAAGALAHNV